MTGMKTVTKTHPAEIELADLLAGLLSGEEKLRLEEHVAGCNECLEKAALAYESVKEFRRAGRGKKRKDSFMGKLNLYLVLAVISFVLSFTVPQYYMQFLVATLLLGIKWVADSKSTRMLVMIYEAWKKGGEKEASRILETLDPKPKNRL